MQSNASNAVCQADIVLSVIQADGSTVTVENPLVIQADGSTVTETNSREPSRYPG